MENTARATLENWAEENRTMTLTLGLWVGTCRKRERERDVGGWVHAPLNRITHPSGPHHFPIQFPCKYVTVHVALNWIFYKEPCVGGRGSTRSGTSRVLEVVVLSLSRLLTRTKHDCMTQCLSWVRIRAFFCCTKNAKLCSGALDDDDSNRSWSHLFLCNILKIYFGRNHPTVSSIITKILLYEYINIVWMIDRILKRTFTEVKFKNTP